MTPRPANIWWLHPAFVFSAAGVLIGISAYWFSEDTYRQAWRTPKFFDLPSLAITLACVGVFSFGVILSSRIISRLRPAYEGDVRTSLPADILKRLFSLSFYLCVLGYVIWTALAIQRGMNWRDVAGVITGQKGAMYEARFTYLPTVGGVTTLTQFGTAAAILGAIVAFSIGWRAVRWKFVILFAMAVFRAMVNSERFALIELVVPLAVTCLGLWYIGAPRIRPLRRRVINWAPVAGVVVLFCLFTAFESIRSWSNFYADRDTSLLEFGARRLTGYYVTSFNNGAYFLQRLEPLNAPYFTLHFLWGFPLSGPAIKRVFPNPLLASDDKWFYFPFLESEANVEFNNADGMLFPLMDYGVAGGLIYWLAIGLFCGYLYQSYRRKQPLGVLLYPATFLGLMEIPLALYWSEGRSFPSLCILVLTPVLVRLVSRKAAPFPERIHGVNWPARFHA